MEAPGRLEAKGEADERLQHSRLRLGDGVREALLGELEAGELEEVGAGPLLHPEGREEADEVGDLGWRRRVSVPSSPLPFPTFSMVTFNCRIRPQFYSNRIAHTLNFPGISILTKPCNFLWEISRNGRNFNWN